LTALDELRVPIPTRADAARAWLSRLAQRLLSGETDERTAAAETSAFLSWNFDLDEVWRTPMAALHVLIDEWDQGWGRGNDILAVTVRQLCADQVRDHGDSR
jgi:hypothetical protein